MRDLLILAIVIPGCLMALRRPWVGVLLWTWLSIMNPHRFAYGFSYSAPLAAAAAATTLIGFAYTRDKSSPMKGTPVTIFAVFCVVVTVSWLAGLDVSGDYNQWTKVMKINLMIFIALALLYSRQHIMLLMWVVVLSIAVLGIKGGVFTVLTGGGHRVWGPPGSFIEDNNEFALALVMTIPLLRFLHLQVGNAWMKRGLLAAMMLCAAAAVGSHSRGALLAITAMAFVFWTKGKHKVGTAIVMVCVGVALIGFMPDEWVERMNTIQTYEEDRSAMGRISAWWNAWNLAWHYPLGVGFNTVRPELFAQYSPYPDHIQGAHSIYFQVLGNHGFPGLILYLAIWFATWRSASWILREAPKHSQAAWCSDLAAMSQVSLIAYAVGGAFLSLAYFDLPYNIMVMVVLTRAWLQRQLWVNETSTLPRWAVLLGCETQPLTSGPGRA